TQGPEHPDTLISKSNLAALLAAQKKFSEAEPLMKDSLASMRRVLGDDHPTTLTNLRHLVGLFNDQQRYAEAEAPAAELFRRAPQSQASPAEQAVYMSAYGPCLVDLGRYSEAESPLLEARRRLHDAKLDRSDAMRSVLRGLAKVCDETGRSAESERWRAELATVLPTTT